MASNRSVIKGITIKIGGDTTELGKALETVNKKGDDLSNELREINRMLKFDPKNTELLAQKQKVLADAVDNTEEKLRQLKEAEAQVQRQFERGEVSEKQVRALQREIIATEGKLKSYKKQAENAEDATKELGDEAEKTGGAFEEMGAKIGSALKAGAGIVVAGAGAAVGALVASAEATREYRTEMGKLTTAFETVGHRTEIAEEAYKRLYSVIGETDQTVEASQQIALLAESEEDVIQWADLGAGVVARFGDALQPETFFEAANETIKLGEATGAYVQLLEGAGYDVEKFNAGLAACTTESEKQAYMLAITDELLGDAADLYRETNAEVMRANDANAAWVATMAEAGASVEPILTDVKLLGASLLGELMPGITGVTDAFRGLINGEEGSAAALGEALSGLLTQLADAVVNLLPAIAEAAVSLISSLITSIISMLPQLLETFVTILMTILEGLNTVIPLVAQAIVDMIPKLVETLVAGIPQLIEGAVQFFRAIIDAIALILPPLLEALPQIVFTFVDGLVQAIPDLIEGAVQFLMAIIQAIPIILDKLLPEIPRIVDTIIDGLLDNLPLLIDGAVTLFFGILEAIPKIIAELTENVPKIVTTIVSGFLKAIPQLIAAGGQLLQGLIDGMLDFDIMGAIRGIGNSIVNGFKNIFDIHSPSRVMADMGEQLDEGLAVGISENADAPVNALDKLSNEMLDGTETFDGVSIERRMTHAYAPITTSNPAEGISEKLDKIYQAILDGKILTIDGKTFVGATAVRYDNELGQRRVLAERGAL